MKKVKTTIKGDRFRVLNAEDSDGQYKNGNIVEYESDYEESTLLFNAKGITKIIGWDEVEPVNSEVHEKKCMLETIKSATGYMGERFICGECHGEIDMTDNYCRWCGLKVESGKYFGQRSVQTTKED